MSTAPVDLRTNRFEWEELASLDPLWSILSEPSKQFSQWKIEEFFATGEQEIAQILEHAAALGHRPRPGRALDFGCGVGRLTRALSTHFSEAVGVDISDRMVDGARTMNAANHRCRFVVNVADHLGMFAGDQFDMIYSSVVLQHVPDRDVILSYVGEFVRILRPGGLLVFQLPSFLPYRNRIQLRRRLYGLLRALSIAPDFLYRGLKLSPMRMNFVPESQVVAALSAHRAEVLGILRGDRGVPGLQSCTYFVTKHDH